MGDVTICDKVCLVSTSSLLSCDESASLVDGIPREGIYDN